MEQVLTEERMEILPFLAADTGVGGVEGGTGERVVTEPPGSAGRGCASVVADDDDGTTTLVLFSELTTISSI